MCNRVECKEFKKYEISDAIINYANLNWTARAAASYPYKPLQPTVNEFTFVTNFASIIVAKDKYQPFVLLS